MMSRKNVQDHFEEVYLRANCARKAFANTEEVNKLLANPMFERCVKYVANAEFKKNHAVLLRHGFGADDMINIVRILGLQFVNNKFVGDTEKDTSYVLMRFMNQKLESFMLFLDRKFRVNERRPDVYLEDQPASFQGNVMFDEVLPEEPEVEEESKARQRLNAFRESIDNMKTALMRVQLSNGMIDYRGRLSEIATSKSVDFNARKKARSLCKKNGIDYVAWAKSEIESKKLNESEFALE